MENRNKVVIGILCVLLVIVGVVAVYFGITSSKSKSELENKIEALENKYASNVVVKDEKEESENKNNEVNEDKENKENKEEKVETVEKIVYKYLPDVSKGKCLNAKDNSIYSVIRQTSFSEIGATIDDNGKTVALNVNWNNAKEMYPELDNTMQGYKNYSITNFSKKVVNVYIFGMGQAVGSEVLYFLMEDGTVEYMPIYKSLKEKLFKSYGKINNISDIVDIARGTVRANEDGSGNGPGWLSVFAINNEGNYYDIGSMIQDKLQ